MAEQHDAPDPQALLALLDGLAAQASKTPPEIWGVFPSDEQLHAEALLIGTLRNALPVLDAGVRALVVEWNRLATNGGVGPISAETYERMQNLATKLWRERDAAVGRLVEVRAENARLRTALEHYAKNGQWSLAQEALAGGKEDAGG